MRDERYLFTFEARGMPPYLFRVYVFPVVFESRSKIAKRRYDACADRDTSSSWALKVQINQV